MHGFACWFDVDFIGSNTTVRLSTGPNKPTTHWYQCRLMLADPIAVNATQVIIGSIVMKANERYSYDIDINVRIKGTNIETSNKVKLQDQIYHYLQSGTDYSNYSYDNWNMNAESGTTPNI